MKPLYDLIKYSSPEIKMVVISKAISLWEHIQLKHWLLTEITEVILYKTKWDVIIHSCSNFKGGFVNPPPP